MKNTEKKSYTIILLAALLVVTVLPFILELLIFRNKFYSVLTNGEWGGFLGSYLGGIISGLGTIVAVWVTTKETRAIQKNTQDNIESDREIRRRDYRRAFTGEVEKIISEYITDISGYYYANRHKKEDYERKLSVKNYYLLKIKLNEIDEAVELIEQLELIHNNYSYGEIPPNQFNKAIDDIMKNLSQFIKNFIGQEESAF